MAFDYASIAADAKALIEEFGRECTFSRAGRAPLDSGKPWRGPVVSAGAGEPLSYSDIIAAIVPTDWVDEEKGVTRKGSQILYVAHDSFPDIEAAIIRTLDTVSDGEWTWHIASVQSIMPGPTAVIYTMKLEG